MTMVRKSFALTLTCVSWLSCAHADVGPGECDGTRPSFESADYQAFGGGQVAVGTQWRQDDIDGVINVYDLTGQSTAPLGVVWPVLVYTHPDWLRSRMGQLFGVALDDQGNIYTNQTAVYLQDGIGSIGGQPGQVYKINSVTGAATVFVTLPNASDPIIASAYGIDESYPQLGNLCFDVGSQMLYVTNFEDGRIYRIDAAGNCRSTWDHATRIVADCTTEPGDDVGAAPLGERVWAVQNFNGRVYYSVWVEDQMATNAAAANEIWSIAQNPITGEFIPGSERLEISVPGYAGQSYSNPVADIAFSAQGLMLIAERSMTTASSTGRFDTDAHQSRILEFVCENDQWLPTIHMFGIGVFSQTNAAGGCDYSYAASPDDRVWVTADAIDYHGHGNPPNIYGIQGVPQTGGNTTNSILIDMDADIIFVDKTWIGSIEVSCPEGAPRCATITDEEILCELDDSGNYTINFTLTNNSGQDVKHLLVLPGSGYTVVPTGLVTLPNLLLDGASTQISLTFNGGQAGDIICFTLSLNTVDFEECCAIEYCFVVPECDCAQVYNVVVEPLCDGTNCFTYTFDVDNLSGDTVFYSYFSPLTPAGVTVDTGNPLDPSRWDYAPLPHLGTGTVSVTICGAMPGEEVCFLMTMHNESLEECCSIKVTVIAPECDPTPNCPADCNGDGVINFFDLSWFLTEYNNQLPGGDINGDGNYNFFDLSLFLMSYNQGCP
ncbi:MAG: GC-type dockerin domain-anchored protein [Phycisphaerales bacterium]